MKEEKLSTNKQEGWDWYRLKGSDIWVLAREVVSYEEYGNMTLLGGDFLVDEGAQERPFTRNQFFQFFETVDISCTSRKSVSAKPEPWWLKTALGFARLLTTGSWSGNKTRPLWPTLPGRLVSAEENETPLPPAFTSANSQSSYGSSSQSNPGETDTKCHGSSETGSTTLTTKPFECGKVDCNGLDTHH